MRWSYIFIALTHWTYPYPNLNGVMLLKGFSEHRYFPAEEDEMDFIKIYSLYHSHLTPNSHNA